MPQNKFTEDRETPQNIEERFRTPQKTAEGYGAIQNSAELQRSLHNTGGAFACAGSFTDLRMISEAACDLGAYLTYTKTLATCWVSCLAARAPLQNTTGDHVTIHHNITEHCNSKVLQITADEYRRLSNVTEHCRTLHTITERH